FYQSDSFIPVWINNANSMRQAASLLTFLNSAATEGLIVRKYHGDQLKHNLDQYKQWISEKQADSLAEFDILLTDACLTYAMDIAKGQLQNYGKNETRNSGPFEIGFKNALDSQRLDVWLRSLPPNNCAYKELKDALARYTQIKNNHGFLRLDDSTVYLAPGDSGLNVLRVRQYLKQTGDLDDSMAADSEKFDSTLEAGILCFQYRNGLHETGTVDIQTLQLMNEPVDEKIGHIMASMERLRWLPPDQGGEYIQVNITDFTLRVIENYSTKLKMRVIVGKPY